MYPAQAVDFSILQQPMLCLLFRLLLAPPVAVVPELFTGGLAIARARFAPA